MKRFVIILMTVAMIFCSCTGKDPLPSDDTVVTINGVDYDVDDKTPLDELRAFYKKLLFGDEAQ